MDVVIHTPDPLLKPQRDLIEQRVRLATQRMASLLSRATVRLKDLNGPRGGVDQHCQIQLQTASGGLLVVSSRGAHWRSSLEMALARAAFALKRHVDSGKSRPRGAPTRSDVNGGLPM
jgi:hypothetical protein